MLFKAHSFNPFHYELWSNLFYTGGWKGIQHEIQDEIQIFYNIYNYLQKDPLAAHVYYMHWLWLKFQSHQSYILQSTIHCSYIGCNIMYLCVCSLFCLWTMKFFLSSSTWLFCGALSVGKLICQAIKLVKFHGKINWKLNIEKEG